VGNILVCVRTTGGAKWWRDTIQAHPETRAYIDGRLANEGESVAPLETLMPFWAAMAAGEAIEPNG